MINSRTNKWDFLILLIIFFRKPNFQLEVFVFAPRMQSSLNIVSPWTCHFPCGFEPEKNSFQLSSVAQLCLNLYDPMDHSMPALSVHHELLEFTQTQVHWVGDAIQPSHPLSSPSPPAFYLSQHQGLSQWVSYLHQVAKVLEFQLQHQPFQWIFRTVLL